MRKVICSEMHIALSSACGSLYSRIFFQWMEEVESLEPEKIDAH